MSDRRWRRVWSSEKEGLGYLATAKQGRAENGDKPLASTLGAPSIIVHTELNKSRSSI